MNESRFVSSTRIHVRNRSADKIWDSMKKEDKEVDS